jgi:hypothetical protein
MKKSRLIIGLCCLAVAVLLMLPKVFTAKKTAVASLSLNAPLSVDALF